MSIQRIVLLGGSGFVGRHLTARLAGAGHHLSVLSRQPHLHKDLSVLPTVRLVAADVHDEQRLTREFRGADAVINLVGILHERGRNGSGFRHVHTDLARKVVDAARRTGVRRLLHMSALNADAAKGASYYLRSKGEAEGLVLTQCGPDLKVTVFQPSVVFGPGDSFISRFSRVLDLAPIVLPLACASARLQPVCVSDVAEAFALALDDRRTHGQRYQLGGPRVWTLGEIVRYVRDVKGRRTRIIALPDGLARLQTLVLGSRLVPETLRFTRDNYDSLQVDSVVSQDGFAHFGIRPSGMDAVVPRYLMQRDTRGQYDAFRAAYGRY